MAVSINDIAKAAEVSIATVSRVINNSSSISPKTRDKVLKVMRDMHYVPNSLARGLSNRKALNVALLIDIEDEGSFHNPFFYEIMHGIESAVYKKGLSLIIASSKRAEIKDTLKWLIQGKRMQGVFIPSSLADKAVITELIDERFPFIGIGEITGMKESISWVDINNRQGGEQAVQHLIDQGYRRIGYIGGELDKLFNKNRLHGYREALLRNGMDVIENRIKICDTTKQDAYIKMHELLTLDDQVDAVVCGDNIISYGAMKAIAEADLIIPKDVGLISFDKHPLATLVEPSITSVDINVFQLGELAASILLQIIENPEISHQQSLISTCIEKRESTRREACQS